MYLNGAGGKARRPYTPRPMGRGPPGRGAAAGRPARARRWRRRRTTGPSAPVAPPPGMLPLVYAGRRASPIKCDGAGAERGGREANTKLV